MSDERQTPAPAESGGSAESAIGRRTFLVVVDDSEEMQIALHFACLRARNTHGVVALLYVQEPAEFQHWLGVGEIMQQEGREAAEALLQELSARVNKLSGAFPVLHVMEGDRAEQLYALIENDPSISVVVLGANAGAGGPGPLITHIMSKGSERIRVPITIVPGALTPEDVEALT